MAILRLELRLEIDTQTKEARVIGRSDARLCPGPCGGNPIPSIRSRHCSVACREAMRIKYLREAAQQRAERALTFDQKEGGNG